MNLSDIKPKMVVKIDPRGHSSDKSHKHWAKAVIIDVGKRFVMAKPFGHKKAEKFDPKYIKLWASRIEAPKGNNGHCEEAHLNSRKT